MKIRDITARAVVAPLDAPIRTASGDVMQAPLVLIDLITDENVIGRAYLFGYHTFTLKPLRELVQQLGEMIRGDELAPFDIDKKLRGRMALFGTRGLQGMAAYNSLGMIPPGEAADAAARTAADGFKAMKVKIGWPTLAEDLAVIRAARKQLGADATLMVDYNQSLDIPEAIRRGRVLDGEGIGWIEEPVRADDYRGAAEVAAQVATPIQIGENFNGVSDMQLALSLEACDLVMPDPQQIGGVTGWLRAAALAQAAGVPCSSHIFIEVAVHLLAATPTCHYIEYLDVAAAVLTGPLPPVDGTLIAPSRPGIGIEWNEDAVKRYTV
jgi:mandelate racemase